MNRDHATPGDAGRGGADRPHPAPMAPYGYCQCGCGGRTPISDRTRRSRGICAGEPIRYIHGHSSENAVEARRKLQQWNSTPHPSHPGCSLVPLSNGGFAVVDDADLPLLKGRRWYWVANRTKTRPIKYAWTSYTENGKKKSVAMHRLIFGSALDARVLVDHRNHDGIDNRRFNLRLSSASQNATNQRKHLDSASQYKGVTPTKSGGWAAQIALCNKPRHRTIQLGRYGAEEEAAFAFSVAAPLIRDPRFVCLSPIPELLMPSAERQAEIRSFVVAKIKAALCGKKHRRASSSPYVGVCPSKGRWRTHLEIGGIRLRLGQFGTAAEAAYARNQAIALVGASMLATNEIGEAEMPDRGRCEAILSGVRMCLDDDGRAAVLLAVRDHLAATMGA